MISYYFPNKAKLFIAVLEEFVGRQAQMERQWLEEVKSMTPARGFAVFLDYQLDYFRLHPEEFRIFALNMVQSEDTEPIPGYNLIQRAINESVKNFIEIVPLSAPGYEVDMFCRANRIMMVLQSNRDPDNPTDPNAILQVVAKPVVWHGGCDITEHILRDLESRYHGNRTPNPSAPQNTTPLSNRAGVPRR